MKAIRIVAAAALLLLVAPVMAQSVHIDHANQLFIGGTSVEDEIIVKQYVGAAGAVEGVEVTINGVDYGQWATQGLAGMTIRGWSGDDLIDARKVGLECLFLEDNPNFTVTITGDNGNDTIFGTHAKDVIYGQRGDDRIYGFRSDDIILGGPGNDIIEGGDGHDVLEGEAGDQDRIFGGCGNDKIGDKDGALKIDGGDGEDKIVLVFHSAWGANDSLLKSYLIGGNDEDFMELFSRAAYAIPVDVNGDERHGYTGGGDRLIVTGNFDDEITVVNVESVIGL